MAEIILPPTEIYGQMASIKDQPTAEVTEIQPASIDQEQGYGYGDENNDEVSAYGRKPKRPVIGRPVPPKKGDDVHILPVNPGKPVYGLPDDPVHTLPVGPGKPVYGLPDDPVVTLPVEPDHPIFVPDGTTLQNVTTHMLCNDWFLKNVREMCEEYKKLTNDNLDQARQIHALERLVSDLKIQVQTITEERDDYKRDYENECAEHQKTQEYLRIVRLELSELKIRYSHTLAELKRHRALLAEAVRDINRLKVELADKESRIRDLEEKLRISNASEDKANEKVTELQRYIYELERIRTAIEKAKDRAERICRDEQDNVKRLEARIVYLNGRIRKLEHGSGHGGRYGTYGAAAEDEVLSQEVTAVNGGHDDPLFEALNHPSSPPTEE